MSTHIQKNSHIRQRAARERGLALYPGFAKYYTVQVCETTDTPELPTRDWFGNLPAQYDIPQSSGPLDGALAQQVAQLAARHAAEVTALTGPITTTTPVVLAAQQPVVAPNNHPNPVAGHVLLQQPHLTNTALQQLLQQFPAQLQHVQQHNHAFSATISANQLAQAQLDQQHADRLRKHGLDLAAMASLNTKDAEALEEHEREIDARRKTLTPKMMRELAAQQLKAKRARDQKAYEEYMAVLKSAKRKRKGFTAAKEAQARRCIEVIKSEPRSREFKRLLKMLRDARKARKAREAKLKKQEQEQEQQEGGLEGEHEE